MHARKMGALAVLAVACLAAVASVAHAADTKQALSYREAVLRAVDQLNEQSSEPNIYRLLELDQPPQDDEDPDSPKRVSFRVKETVCSRTTQQPPEQCDFKENGLLKRCEGTVTLDQVRGNFDITCNNHQSIRITKQPWAPPQAARLCRIVVIRVCRGGGGSDYKDDDDKDEL
nr:ars1-sp_Cathelicidin-1_FLAG_KDEL [synthetic construct]